MERLAIHYGLIQTPVELYNGNLRGEFLWEASIGSDKGFLIAPRMKRRAIQYGLTHHRVHLPARPICTLCRLLVSWRYSRQTAKEPRPAGIPMMLGQAGPQHRNARKLSSMYVNGNMERVGGKKRKTATAKQSAAGPNPRWMRKKEKRKRRADGPDKRSPGCSARTAASHSRTPATINPTPVTWEATLAPSQARATSAEKYDGKESLIASRIR